MLHSSVALFLGGNKYGSGGGMPCTKKRSNQIPRTTVEISIGRVHSQILMRVTRSLRLSNLCREWILMTYFYDTLN